jgi:hypothetical protein
MREIEGLSLNGMQPIDELLELVPGCLCRNCPASSMRPVIMAGGSGKRTSMFSVSNTRATGFSSTARFRWARKYRPPLNIDVKNVPYRLFQIIDTGEEDDFSTIELHAHGDPVA